MTGPTTTAHQTWPAWLTGVSVFLGLRILGVLEPSWVSAFGRMAAAVAAILLGVPLEGGSEPVLAHPDYPIQVVVTCSGWSFFCLLAALLSGRAMFMPRGVRSRWPLAVLAIPVAALLALLTNAGRFVAVLVGGLYVLPHLPSVAVASFHTALGVAVFLPVLIITYVFWDRRFSHVG